MHPATTTSVFLKTDADECCSALVLGEYRREPETLGPSNKSREVAKVTKLLQQPALSSFHCVAEGDQLPRSGSVRLAPLDFMDLQDAMSISRHRILNSPIRLNIFTS